MKAIGKQARAHGDGAILTDHFPPGLAGALVNGRGPTPAGAVVVGFFGFDTGSAFPLGAGSDFGFGAGPVFGFGAGLFFDSGAGSVFDGGAVSVFGGDGASLPSGGGGLGRIPLMISS